MGSGFLYVTIETLKLFLILCFPGDWMRFTRHRKYNMKQAPDTNDSTILSTKIIGLARTNLYGEPLRIMQKGGRFVRERCECSAPLYWSYDDAGMMKACMKGESCIHTVKNLIYMIVAAGWTFAECEDVALDPANIGFTWLQVQDDVDTTLAQYWNRAVDSDPKPLKQAAGKRTPKQAKKAAGKPTATSSGWSGADADLIDRVLAIVVANPGAGTRAIQRAMRPTRDGHTLLTISACLDRGYLSYEIGPRNTHLHTVAKMPSRKVPIPGADGRVSLDPEPISGVALADNSLLSVVPNMDYCHTGDCHSQIEQQMNHKTQENTQQPHPHFESLSEREAKLRPQGLTDDEAAERLTEKYFAGEVDALKELDFSL